MKRKLKTILSATLFIASIVGAFFIGTVTKTKTVTVEVEKEVIPENYIDTTSDDFKENYIDLREIIAFEQAEKCWGVYLFKEDGNYYYWGE